MTGSKHNKKIAIYGGSFDPIHVGHIALANAAVRELGIEKLIFMPTYISPFKKDAKATDSKDRCGMIETVLSQNSVFCLSKYEIRKKGSASYTIETLNEFEEIIGIKPHFVLGFDSVVTLDKWYKGDEILRSFPLITARRNDTDDEEGLHIIEGFRQNYGADISVLSMDPVDAASSDIRLMVKSGMSISGLVTAGVEKYIHSHRLYKQSGERHSKFCRDIDALEQFTAYNLTEKRYRHSLGVQRMAAKLAQINDIDIEKAAFAGRYHDIAKCFDMNVMDSYIEKYSLDKGLLGNPALAHSKVGAAILENEFGVNDEEILNAIRYHTTARYNMSKLEQITFVADVVEDNRTYPDLKYYQHLAINDIDRCTLEILEYTISDLTQKCRIIDKDTLMAYDQYKSHLNNH